MKIRKKLRSTKINPLQVIACGFAIVILLGSVLLSLPCAAQDGKSIGFMDGLFTSTSAVCVTGLVVRDTGTTFSLFGQIVLLCLIQVGGLGFLTFATMILRMIGRQASLRERMLIRESMNEDGTAGMDKLIRWVAVCAFSVEFAGAVLLCFRFIPMYGVGKGIYYSVFHAVSAFCNAGFDLFGNYSSLTGFRGDVLVNFTAMLMIVVGGLGFGVLRDLRRRMKGGYLRLQTRLVLSVYFSLTLIGFVFTLVFEWNNPGTIGSLPFGEKLLAALFHSVTLRTAGFNTVDLAALRPASKLLNSLLMLIGAAPASTGGGVKVTTIAVILLSIRMTLRGDHAVSVYKRSVSGELIRRAIAVASIAVCIWLVDVIAISAMQPELPLADVLFECASAVGTVGVSAFGSASLNAVSRVLIIITMYIGRIGPMTAALMLARKQDGKKARINYPEGNIMIG